MVSKTHGYQDQIAGAVKETSGKIFGNEKMQLEGEAQKLRGKDEVEHAKAHAQMKDAGEKIEGNIREKADFIKHGEHHEGELTKSDRLKSEARAALSCTKPGCETACQCGPNLKLGEQHFDTGVKDQPFERKLDAGLRDPVPQHFDAGARDPIHPVGSGLKDQPFERKVDAGFGDRPQHFDAEHRDPVPGWRFDKGVALGNDPHRVGDIEPVRSDKFDSGIRDPLPHLGERRVQHCSKPECADGCKCGTQFGTPQQSL